MKKLEKVVYDTYNQGYNIEVIKYLYNLSNIELASLLIKHSNSSNEFYLMNNDYKIVYYEKPNFKIGKRENITAVVLVIE